MGNEYHSLCCGLSGFMYAIELVEGKDRPRKVPPPKFSHFGKVTGLLLCLTDSIHHSARVVIMDSGFCELFAVVKLASFVVYGSAVIKKLRFWPKYIQIDAIDRRFEGKEIGFVDALPGLLEGQHNFKIFCMKEEDYVIKLMSTCVALRSVEEGKTQQSVIENEQRVNKSFHYTEHFFNHFKFCHQVDDHNNLRHSTISLEERISSKDWKIRVFMFILALVEVNAWLAVAFITKSPTMNELEF